MEHNQETFKLPLCHKFSTSYFFREFEIQIPVNFSQVYNNWCQEVRISLIQFLYF